MNSPIPRNEERLMRPFKRGAILELGNKKNLKGPYKAYFKNNGFKHVSIDWNGKDGALSYDLREPVKPFAKGNKWCQYFDMVTNIGTSEHVIPQGFVWQNMLDALKIGGVLICVTPLMGHWWWHQDHGQYPTKSFYKDLALYNGLKIERLYTDLPFPKTCVHARLVKEQHVDTVTINEEMIYVNRQQPRGRSH